MKVGTFAFATDQGLGVLAKSFYDNGVVTDVLPILHSSRPNHEEWYPKADKWVTNLRDESQRRLLIYFAEKMDVMMFFETPFWWPIISVCRNAGVKTVLMPMYECMPKELPVQPDLIINPSLLDQQYYPSGVFIPVPVSVPWRQRTRAEVFVHNAGHGGLKGRNGTAELLEALEHIKSPAKIIIRCQDSLYRTANHRQVAQLTNPLIRRGQKLDYDTALSDENAPPVEKMVDLRVGTVPYSELYNEGDVFIFPEKFNGLSLPLQEARGAGMLVMGTRRFPIDQWLPVDPLITPRGYSQIKVGSNTNTVNEATVYPEDIAAKIDEWYGKDITEYSDDGLEYAHFNSWEALRPLYLNVLEGL